MPVFTERVNRLNVLLLRIHRHARRAAKAAVDRHNGLKRHLGVLGTEVLVLLGERAGGDELVERLNVVLDGHHGRGLHGRRDVANGHALDGHVVNAGLVGRVGDVLQLAPGLPGKAEAAALVEARVAREADTGGLVNALDDALGEEAAAVALLAGVDKAAAAGHHGAAFTLDGVDAACAVDAGLGAVERRRVKLGVVVPLDRGHLWGVEFSLASRGT